MALKIRLARAGAKKRPYYKVVVADVRSPRDGRFVEKVGTYDPLLDQSSDKRVTFNKERVVYWLSVGATPTDRVARFLGDQGVIEKSAMAAQTKKDKPKAKALERLAEQKAAEEVAKEAEAAAIEEEKAAKAAAIEEARAAKAEAKAAAIEEARAAKAEAKAEAKKEEVPAEAVAEAETTSEA